MFHPSTGHIEGLQALKRVMQGLWLFYFSFLPACVLVSSVSNALIEVCFLCPKLFSERQRKAVSDCFWRGRLSLLTLAFQAVDCQQKGRNVEIDLVLNNSVTMYIKILDFPATSRSWTSFKRLIWRFTSSWVGRLKFQGIKWWWRIISWKPSRR